MENKFEETALAVIKQPIELAITDIDVYALANDYLLKLTALKKEAKTIFRPEIKKQYDLYQFELAKETKIVKLIEEKEKKVKAACVKYNLEEDAKRAEAERLAKEEADRKTKETQTLILNSAAEFEKEGDTETASNMLKQAEEYVAPVQEFPEVDAKPTVLFSETGRASWKPDIEVTLKDAALLIKAIADGGFPVECVKVELRMKETKEFFNKREINTFNDYGLLVEPTYASTKKTY